jgi:hypothetical protein
MTFDLTRTFFPIKIFIALNLMDTGKEISLLRVAKVVITVLSLALLLFVAYNIGAYTNSESLEVFAGKL